jgi:hypothetical protein
MANASTTKAPAPIHDAARIVQQFKAVSSKVKAELNTTQALIALHGQLAEWAGLRDLGAMRELLAALEKFNQANQDI